jgi:hypothetical protein
MKKNEIIELFVRYIILLVLGISNLVLFYIVFTPLTVYPIYWITLLFDPQITKLLPADTIFFAGNYIEIIPACVAGAAYYLLAILNLTTKMDLEKRVKSLLFLFFSFLVINIARIVIFIGLLVTGSKYFDAAHVMVWYFGSTILVVALWFVNVAVYKIKEIPIYSDVRRIIDSFKK